MEIIPGINCSTAACVREKVALAVSFFEVNPSVAEPFVHIDVTDGRYTSYEAFNDVSSFREIKGLFAGISFEVHLMIAEPHLYIEEWLLAGADRVIVHPEASTPQLLQPLLSRFPSRIVLSHISRLSLALFVPYAKYLTHVQVLAVAPGPANQVQDENIFRVLADVKAFFPHVWIEVDGGVKEGQLQNFVKSGVDAVVVTSALFQSDDPVYSYSRFVSLAQRRNLV